MAAVAGRPRLLRDLAPSSCSLEKQPWTAGSPGIWVCSWLSLECGPLGCPVRFLLAKDSSVGLAGFAGGALHPVMVTLTLLPHGPLPSISRRTGNRSSGQRVLTV